MSRSVIPGSSVSRPRFTPLTTADPKGVAYDHFRIPMNIEDCLNSSQAF